MIPILNAFGPLLMAGLTTVALAFLLFAVLRVWNSRGQSNRLDKVLSSYARTLGAGEAAALGLRNRVRFEFFDKFLKATDERLAAAGVEIPAQTWTLGSVAASVVVGLLAAIFFGSWILGVLMGGIVAFYLLNAYLAGRIKSRSVKFAGELPQVLALIASGLRAGLTFPSAMNATATQDQGEVGRQFRRALAEVQFGSSMEDALRRVATRMSSEDLAWLVLALEIQREVGGSLSGILDGVATTIKGRAEVQREVRVISAEGRMSGYVLIALPVVAFVALFVIRPEYVKFFWTDPVGIVLLGVFAAMMAIGWIWMNKVVSVRV